MKIRKFYEKDAQAVCNIIRRNDLEISSKFYPIEVIESWLIEMTPEIIQKKARDRICFVSEEDGIITGHISYFEGEIKKLHVLPEFHKKGIGKKLIERLEITLPKNTSKIVVNSSIYAEPFYKSCGFNKIRDEWEEIGNTKYKFIYMEKQIK
jgi:predicted N-acetyltransferase YhbS